jgi:cation:H+ antiporter
MTHVLLLLASAAAIYLACEVFVNAIEHLGRAMSLGTIAVGSVLAAVGTALPESIVTGIAVTIGNANDVGVGAALGGPLALATIAYAIVGGVLLLRRQPIGTVSLHRLRSDQRWFLIVFAAKIGVGLVAFAWKPWLGLLFFAGYGVYVISELRAEASDDGEELEPLLLGRSVRPSLPPVLVQVLVSLGVIFVASEVFVAQLTWAGPQLGLSDAVTALLLAPVATELPEVANAIIWVRQGKVQLALANISGSMMVQATVPSGLAILFTPWDLGGPLLLAAVATAAAVAFLLFRPLTASTLLATGLGYVAFAAALPFV